MAKEGDTVEPGTRIAVISKSGEGVMQAAQSEKAASQPPSPPAEKESVEKQIPKVEPPKSEITNVKKEKAPSPPTPKPTASEPQLPPKERERRVSSRNFFSSGKTLFLKYKKIVLVPVTMKYNLLLITLFSFLNFLKFLVDII